MNFTTGRSLGAIETCDGRSSYTAARTKLPSHDHRSIAYREEEGGCPLCEALDLLDLAERQAEPTASMAEPAAGALVRG